MVRNIIAILVGYLVLVLVVAVGIIAASIAIIGTAAPAPGTPLPSAYLAANLIISGLGALAGGFATASIARTLRFRTASFLAVIILIVGVLTAVGGPQPGQPSWYPWVIPVVGAAGAVAGGWLKAG